MNIIYLDTPWTRVDVENDSEYLYIFTDNLNRTSGFNKNKNNNTYYAYRWRNCDVNFCYPYKTQAVIRGLLNAFPITTMKDQFGHQLDDSMYDQMATIWKSELGDICSSLNNSLLGFKGIKCSSKQFGNGTYSNMKENAPKLFELLNELLHDILGIDNNSLKK